MKFRVYAIQGVQFNDLVVDAVSEEDAKKQYDKAWNNGEIYSVDYLPDGIRYIVTKAE